MPESREAKITRLLKRGLNHYGLGDLEAAIASWDEVLGLDPGNRAALDYLDAAREEAGGPQPRRSPRREAPGPARPAADDDDATPRTLEGMLRSASKGGSAPDGDVEAALAAYKAGDLDRAYRLLVEVARVQPDRLDVEGYLSMLRAKRAKSWAREIGDQGRALRVAKPLSELTKLDLKPDEGFLLSQIDGVLTIEQVLSLQTDRVRGLEIIARMLQDGILQ